MTAHYEKTYERKCLNCRRWFKSVNPERRYCSRLCVFQDSLKRDIEEGVERFWSRPRLDTGAARERPRFKVERMFIGERV